MTDTAELIARTTRLEPIAWRAVKALRYSLGWTALADALSEYIAAAASLTEQVEGLKRERDDALATISLLQSQHRTAVIEGLTRDVNRYAYERDKAREERDKAERRSEAFWKPQVETAEAELSRLRAENEKLRELVEQAFLDGIRVGLRDVDPNIAWLHSSARASLSNTSEGGKDE